MKISNDPKEVLKEFFELLDYTEESDSGKVFHPITMNCCRVFMQPKMELVLMKMKLIAMED